MPVFEERGLPARNRTILVVEDNDMNREMLKDILEDKYAVLEAVDGQAGIELLQRHCDDLSLVLLDVYMPVLDGFGFLKFRASDERYSNIPVIVATASDVVEDEVKCLQLGANDFVKKPYNAEVIRNRVANTIRLRETASVVNQLRWDNVTSLYRGDFFYRRVNNLLEAYPDIRFDMVCSDIADFKTLNERYGRSSCDRLLHDLANCLAADIPGVAASGRVGGDSFGFLVEHSEVDWAPLLGSIVKSMGIPHLYVRFGVVQDVDHTIEASSLCNYAIIALEELRESVGAGVALYDEALRARKALERSLVECMHEGIEQRQFVVYYQPKHELTTGNVSGAEALVRWIHPELGFVRPDIFISLFERNGMITKLDWYVYEEACIELARLTREGLPVVPISINVSPLDFDDLELPKKILALADKYDIDHSLLHLELTETAYADDPSVVVNALNELRSYGFKIELDDFGSGYSSLALLNILPLDILKIDGGIVRQASQSDDFRIIQTAIQIAQVLGLETVIEGVETAEALERLRSMGCDVIQGFYYSWPLRQSDFENYLLEH